MTACIFYNSGDTSYVQTTEILPNQVSHWHLSRLITHSAVEVTIDFTGLVSQYNLWSICSGHGRAPPPVM